MTEIRRNSNLELYRIICMFMIVIHHYCVHGFGLEYLNYDTNKYILDILSSWGKVGVDGFILLSGYFMIQSKFTVQKFLKVWGQVWFYTMGIFFAFYFTGNVNPEMTVLLFRRSVLPVSYSMYWFVTYYLVLMILSPFLNTFIHSLEQKQHRNLIIILLLMWSVLDGFFEMDHAFSLFGWFVTLYLVAGYVRLHMPTGEKNAKKYGIGAVIFALLIVMSTVLWNAVGLWTNTAAYWTNSRINVDQERDFFVFAFAFCFFMYLLNRKPSYHRWINFVASLSFGVYLFHDNYFTRVYLWMVWFKIDQYYYEWWLGLAVLGIGAGVYVVASLIDCVRKYTVERIWMKLVDFVVPRIDGAISRILKRGINFEEK